MRTPVLLALLAVSFVPRAASAQDTARTTTRLLLGVGLPRGASELTPAWVAGIEVTPRRSLITYRLAAEEWERERTGVTPFGMPYSSKSRSSGIQLLALRNFGTRRVQPYFLAGMGLYSSQDRGYGPRYAPTDSGIWADSLVAWNRRETDAMLIWGVGTSVRLGGMRLLVEAKLPLYHRRGFYSGPQSPLLIGLRF